MIGLRRLLASPPIVVGGVAIVAIAVGLSVSLAAGRPPARPSSLAQIAAGGSVAAGIIGPSASSADVSATGMTASPAASSGLPTGSVAIPASTPSTPTAGPTTAPPAQPTAGPTPRPTAGPTPRPTARPTPRPTARPTPAPTTRPTPAPTPAGWPAIGHIYEIVLENHELSSVIGNVAAPYLNSLAHRYGLATNMTAVAHPSLPNYLALWSGSTQGVHDDNVHVFTTARTLADQIELAGRSWLVAAQNVPLPCFTGESASGGEDGPGSYARKHEPAISWQSVAGNPSRCGRITDFRHFDAGVGNFWFIAPNLCNDMHDCSVATGDKWLQVFLPRILGSAAYQKDGLIMLTFDEGSSNVGGGGRVATIVISPKARTSFVSNQAHTHYSLVRTIESLWGMPCLRISVETDQPFRSNPISRFGVFDHPLREAAER